MLCFTWIAEIRVTYNSYKLEGEEMTNRISLNGTSYHGAGAVAEVVTEFNSRGFKKAFVASDPDLIKFGVTAKVTDLFDKAGIPYEIYSDIKPNPTIENVKNLFSS